MNSIAKIVGISVVVWGFVFLCVVAVWCFANASESAQSMRLLVVCVGVVAALFAATIVTVPFWFIFKRAGARPALSIVMLVPLVNLAALYWIAFSQWNLGPAQSNRG